MSAFAAYVVCATQRSGSTLLCDLLTASGAGRPNSYFRGQDIAYWAELWGVGGSAAEGPAFNRSYLAAMKAAGTADTGLFGLRLMWVSIDGAGARLNAALGDEDDIAAQLRRAFGPTRFIHLSRRDKVAQAVSLVRAEQTGLWHVAPDGSERERLAPARPPMFDPARVRQACEMLSASDAQWSAFFEQRAIRPLRIMYEDLAADPGASVAAILSALGRDPRRAADLAAATGRMADAVSAEWSARIRAGPGR